MLKGIGIGEGIGIGTALKYINQNPTYEERPVTDASAEKSRLSGAIEEFCTLTRAQADRMGGSAEGSEILLGHIAMINDPFMLSQMHEQIDAGSCAEKALETVCDMFAGIFSAADDELTRQRAADIEDIKSHVLRLLLGISSASLSHLPKGTVLAVDELTPSMTAEFDKDSICGIVAQKGGTTSHAAIICRSLGIPAVLGVSGILDEITDGKEIIIDASCGEIYMDFDAAFKDRCIKKQQAHEEAVKNRERFRGKPSVTADGQKKEIFANIGSPAELQAVIDSDAEGIGLFRTEFLFMDKSALPSEEEQFAAYKSVAAGMKGKPVIIRTLDVGGDKDIPYLGLKKEENPFMGFRAVRYCLKHEELYRCQLRAILRASAYGDIRIMIPLVTTVDEIIAVKKIISDIKEELKSSSIPYKEDIEVGVMIETPAACLIADILAKEADFFSIGTNDLTGYIMAADRGNSDVEYLYSSYDPAVLRAIKHIIRSAHEAGIPCGMCGEAAADTRLLALLVSFGLDEFSVNPTSVLAVRAALSYSDKGRCDSIADDALSQNTASKVRECLESL